jgi:diglucosylglycerate octanoyltransferase
MSTPPRSSRAGPSAAAGRDALRLVVLGDSTAFTDATGPQLPDHPTLYPNVVARRLEAALGRPVAATVLAQPGQTTRDAVRALTKDRHVQFEVVAPADAVIVGLGSFDHAPLGTPPVLDAIVPYLRPTALRRSVRRVLRALHPHAVRLTGGRRPRTPPREFERLFTLLLTQIRGLTWGRAAGVVLGPTSHRSPYYGHRHPGHARAEARQLGLARAHGFAAVPVWEHVRDRLTQLNPDGIHWPVASHAAVGRAAAAALLEQLTDETPRIGLPGAGRAQAASASPSSETVSTPIMSKGWTSQTKK